MRTIKISTKEFDVMAQRINLPIVESTYEDTRAAVEAWLNNAAAFNDRFTGDDKYRDLYMCFSVRK